MKEMMLFSRRSSCNSENAQVIRINASKARQYVSFEARRFSYIYGLFHSNAQTLPQIIVFSTEFGHILNATPGHDVYISMLSVIMCCALVVDGLTLYFGRNSNIAMVDVKMTRGLYISQKSHDNVVERSASAIIFTSLEKDAYESATLLLLHASKRMWNRNLV